MSTVVTRRRVARKEHRCDNCGRRIAASDVYLIAVRFPDDINSSSTPWRIKECARCAIRYGHELELGDIPYEQCAKDGLL